MRVTMVRLALLALAVTAPAGGPAFAQDPPDTLDELDVTMRIIEDAEARDGSEVTNRITLPPAVRAGAETPGSAGSKRSADTAAEARERGREAGREMSEAAREMAERAAEERGNAGRARRDELAPAPPEDPPRPPRP